MTDTWPMSEVTLTIQVPDTLEALAVADKVLADRGAVASQSIVRLIWAQILGQTQPYGVPYGNQPAPVTPGLLDDLSKAP